MKVRNLAATLALAISLPIALHTSAMAQENLEPGTDTRSNIEAAKDRLDKAKVRLDIAGKQVEAAKARLKAADAEYKAAKANHDARNLEHQAKKLSDASGLPEITEGQIERTRTKAIAEKVVEPAKEAPQAPVDLSGTRLDFNAQPEGEHSGMPATEAPVAPAPETAPSPDKQASVEPAYNMAPPQVAATEQPPIVP